jgi:hypothetical protein
MERLDWFFSSSSWTIKYPKSVVKSLVMKTSDHWPCIVEIDIKIPRGRISRFENHWLIERILFLFYCKVGLWNREIKT